MASAVVLAAPVFGQLVYSVTRPEGNYITMVCRSIFHIVRMIKESSPQLQRTQVATVSATTSDPNSVRYTQQTRSMFSHAYTLKLSSAWSSPMTF